jgi:hypothetical protein
MELLVFFLEKEKDMHMKIITRVCLLIMALGLVLGWILLGGFGGSIIGLFVTGCLAIPLYCLTSVFTRNAVVIGADPFQDTPSSINLDRSQLPKGAYKPPHSGGL